MNQILSIFELMLPLEYDDIITPYKAIHDCITSKIKGVKLIFSVLEK